MMPEDGTVGDDFCLACVGMVTSADVGVVCVRVGEKSGLRSLSAHVTVDTERETAASRRGVCNDVSSGVCNAVSS